MKNKEKKLIEAKWFTRDIIKTMILENLIRAFSNDFNKNSFINMSIANDEKNHLAKHIKEFKSKT